MCRRLVVLVALVGLLLAPASAVASFPGVNGAIAFVRDGDVWTVGPDGSAATQITSGPADDRAPAWSADGSTIAFSRTEGEASADIWLVRPGSPPVRLTNTASFSEFAPAWSPDGKRLTFARACALSQQPNDPACGPYDVMRTTLVAARTDGPETFDIGLGGYSGWSPDGQRIVFDTGWDAGGLSLANWNGTGVADLPGSDWQGTDETGVGIDFSPSWSPDGGRIAFARSRPGAGTGISVIRPDGTEFTHLIPTGTGADASGPAWSPDGRLIAYQSAGEIWLMNADGSDRRPITSGLPPGLPDPDWQPLQSQPGPVSQSPGAGVPSAGPATTRPRRLVVRVARRMKAGDALVIALRFSLAVTRQRVSVQRKVNGRFTTILSARVNGTAPRLRLRLTSPGRHVLRIAYRAGGRLHLSRPLPVLVRR